MTRNQRDTTLFLSGLLGAAYALFFNPNLPSEWLFLFGGMMGVTALLRVDEKGGEK